MTKTQIRIYQLQKLAEQAVGMRQYLIRLRMAGLEILVALHKMVAVFYRKKSDTFETFASRDESGSFTESYTEHERFRKVSTGGVGLVIFMAIVYATSGIFIPNRIAVDATVIQITDLGDSGAGTLREALTTASSTDVISFDANFPAGGTITLITALPDITTNTVTIDGDVDNDGTPDIVLDGATNTVVGNGLTITADFVSVEGLVINGFSAAGISIEGSNNSVASSYIGTNAAGDTAVPNGADGIVIVDDGVGNSENNLIGGTTIPDRNIISGNTESGIELAGSLVQNNDIAGNYIGVNPAGDSVIPNGAEGVLVTSGATGNTVGGPDNTYGNILSGNTTNGVTLSSTGVNTVSFNAIGTNPAGSLTLGNVDGVVVTAGDQTIQENVISGNTSDGVVFTGATASTVIGNGIGVNTAGLSAIPNASAGVRLDGATTGVTVGGTSAADRNYISGNAQYGVVIEGASTANTVQGNYIGTNFTGDTSLPNATGILITGAGTDANVIGGDNPASDCTTVCNVLSGNSTYEVNITNDADGNFVQGNYVGLVADGTGPIINDRTAAVTGIYIGTDSDSNQIGGARDDALDELGEGNVVGGYDVDTDADDVPDEGVGIELSEDAHDGVSVGNSVLGNLIGLNPSGALTDDINNDTGAAGADGQNDLLNHTGVRIQADFSSVGDGTDENRNAIASNTFGAVFAGDGTSFDVNDAVFAGNYVGTDKTGELAVDASEYNTFGPFEKYYGVWVYAADGIDIADNVMSGNYGNPGSSEYGSALVLGNGGLSFDAGNVQNSSITGNLFGTDKDGTDAIPNNRSIECNQVNDLTIGGPDAADRNIISASGYQQTGGPLGTDPLGDFACYDIVVQNNYFGTDITGNSAGTNDELANNNGIDIGDSSGGTVVFQDNVIAASGEGIYSSSNDFDNVTIDGNNFGLGADNATSLPIGLPLNFENIENSTINDNVFANADEYGVSLETSNNVTLSNNYFGTDRTEELDIGNGSGGFRAVNGFNIDFDNNVVANNSAVEEDLYTMSLSPLSFGGNDYASVMPGVDCPAGTTAAVNVVTLRSSNLESSPICANANLFINLQNTVDEISAYLVNDDGDRYTFYVADDQGALTCDIVAGVFGGNGDCDAEFTAFSLDGLEYAFNGFGAGVSVVSGGVNPPEIGVTTLELSGASFLGVVGPDSDITSSDFRDNEQAGINVLGSDGLLFDGNTVDSNANEGVVVESSNALEFYGNSVTDNGSNGLYVDASTSIVVGGTGAGQANTVSGHTLNGIALVNGTSESTISSNIITDNGGGVVGGGDPDPGDNPGGGGNSGGYVASAVYFENEGTNYHSLLGSPGAGAVWITGGAEPTAVAADDTVIQGLDGSFDVTAAFFNLGAPATLLVPDSWRTSGGGTACENIASTIQQDSSNCVAVASGALWENRGAEADFVYNDSVLPAGFTLAGGLTNPPTLVWDPEADGGLDGGEDEGDGGEGEGGGGGGSTDSFTASLAAFSFGGEDYIQHVGGGGAENALYLSGGEPQTVSSDGATVDVASGRNIWVALFDIGPKLTIYFPEHWLGADPASNDGATNCATIAAMIGQDASTCDAISTDAVFTWTGSASAFTWNAANMPTGSSLYTGHTDPPTLTPAGGGGASLLSLSSFTDPGSLNGSGVFINESSNNTLYNNTLTSNTRGVAISSSEATGSSGNVIGGTGANQANTISSSTSSGILIQNALTQSNSIIGNSITGNLGHGIDNDNTHDGDNPTPGTGDNTIRANTINSNTLSGIRNFGGSPAIYGNTINGNSDHGIVNLVDFGASTNPDTASDDVISSPVIGSESQPNAINGNSEYGIYSLDTAPSNKDTVGADNNLGSTNSNGRVRQDWYGLVQAQDESGPDADAHIRIYGSGQPDPLASFTTGSNGYGPTSASLTDAETWQVVPEFVVSSSGTLQDFSPHFISATGSAGTASFDFNGEDKGLTGFGNIDGRYQVATVLLTNAPNTISGVVWVDADRNGTMDTGEDSKSGVTVTVKYDTNGNGFLDGGDSTVSTLTSDSDGNYEYANAAQGTYFVVVTVPTGYVLTTGNSGSAVTFSGEDESAAVNFGVDPDVDVASNTGTIQGSVFEDKNSDGIKNAGEGGVKEVTITLFADTNGNGQFNAGTDSQIGTSTSNDAGGYLFTNVALGDYFLRINVPEDSTLTTDNDPTDILELTADGQTLTENFGLNGGDLVTQPPTTTGTPNAGATAVSRLGILAPQTGAAAVNSAVAALAVILAIANLAFAVPGSVWPAFLRLLLDGFTEPLMALFGAKKLPWGRLFNSLNKQPIDLGLVRLYDAKSRILMGTAVTDRTGRFKFLPKVGVYTAKASKADYSFPSSLLASAPLYEKRNMYFGDDFKIDETVQVFDKDIPLDPTETEGEAREIFKQQVKRALHTVVAFTGITIGLINVILLPSILTVSLLVIHVILLAVFWRLAMPAKPKPWGRVYDEETKKPIQRAIVRIYDQKFGRLLDTAITDRNGRFGFLVGPSKYYITVDARDYSFPGSKKKTGNDYLGGEIEVQPKSTKVDVDVPLKKQV